MRWKPTVLKNENFTLPCPRLELSVKVSHKGDSYTEYKVTLCLVRAVLGRKTISTPLNESTPNLSGNRHPLDKIHESRTFLLCDLAQTSAHLGIPAFVCDSNGEWRDVTEELKTTHSHQWNSGHLDRRS